jgi:hypothetical protein
MVDRSHCLIYRLGERVRSKRRAPTLFLRALTPRSDGSYPAILVADVKYKDFIQPRRPEIEQAITYAASYRVPVVITHPRVDEKTHGMHLFQRTHPHTI